MAEAGIKYICDLCGCLIEIGQTRYIFKGELTAAYDGGTFDETYSGGKESLKQEMQRLIELAEQKTEKELTDEVYYPFRLDLCCQCRKKIYRIVEEKSGFALGE